MLLLLMGVWTGQARSRVLRVGIPTFPASLNPVYATDETSQCVMNRIYDSLFIADGAGRIRKAVIKRYDVSSDRKRIRLELCPGIRFSTGSDLSASDVAKTLGLLQNPSFGYPYASTLDYICGIRILGSRSLILEVRSLRANWKNSMQFKILDDTEISGIEAADFRSARPSGSGFYRLGRVQEPAVLELVANRWRHPTRGMAECIEMQVIPFTHLVPLKLIREEVDLCELQPEHIDAYRRNKRWRERFDVLKYRKFGYTYLVFNLRSDRVTDVVRKLVYNVTVGGDFVSQFLRGRGEPVFTPFLLLNEEIEPVPFPEVVPKQRVRLRVVTNSESKLRREFVLFLREVLRDKRIDLQPRFLEYRSFLQALKTGGFDMALSGFLLDMDYDLIDVLSEEGHFNYAGYRSQAIDRLLLSGLSELNPRKRREIYRQAHRCWYGDLPLIPLFNLYYYVGARRSLTLSLRENQWVGASGDFLQSLFGQ